MNSSPNASPRDVPPPSSGFGQDLRDTLEVLASPVATFRRLRNRSAVLAPWLLISLVTVGLTFFTISISQRASVHLLADMEDPALVESVAQQLEQMKWISLGLAPIHVLALWGVTATLFWSLGALGAGVLKFRTALSIAAYAAVPSVLGKALDLGVTWFQGPEFTTGMMPVLTSASSVAVLLPGLVQPEWLVAMVRHITVFTAWSGVLWVIGLREATPTTWGRAAVAAVTVWVVFLAAATAGEVVSSSLAQMTNAG